MNFLNPTLRNRNGFALPMAILAIAGLILLLVGMLSVLGLERKTARSYSDTTRAELAVDSGLAEALSVLSEIATHDGSLVFRLEDPEQPTVPSNLRPLGYREQFFTYGAIFENNAWRGIPLFSAAPETSLGFSQIDAQSLSSALPAYLTDATQLGHLTEYDQNIPRAKWVEVPPSNPDEYTFRYAFWIEDLSGRISGKTAGTLPRAEGESTAELDYATIFYPESETPELPRELTATRDKLRSSASIRPLFETLTESKLIEPYIHFYNASIPAPKLIPQGFGYPDAGQPAPDLNAFIAAADVEGITAHIKRQLPNFADRKGGFPDSDDYIKTLAASIIDYADTDSDATTEAGFRGIDSYPFVNELFDRYEWVSGSPGQIAIKVETFIELWNPTQLQISGNMEFTNVNKHTINIPLSGQFQFSQFQFPAQAVTIPPNGFLVITLGEHTYTFPEGSFTPSELNFIDPTKNDDYATTENTFLLKWNGKLVDTVKGGLQRTDGLLRAGFSNRKWKGNGSPAHNWSIGRSGDPRSSFYINTKVIASSYGENSNWGGRALKRSISENEPYREVRLEKWADRGSNSTPGVNAGTDARVPSVDGIILKSSGTLIADKSYPANQPDMAPTFISNSGTYKSLGELGHIFDPAQWSSVENSGAISDMRSGGGFTLAIGRPEYAPFDIDGLRAAQLLDIFYLPALTPTTTNRININTAPREVLRSFIAGITLEADPMAPDMKPKKLEFIGDIFADYVIAQRNASPLRSISDLNNIRKQALTTRDPENTDHTPFFGNIALLENAPVVSDPTIDQIELDDAGREELFRKTMNLISFKSNRFRIVVAGEVISKKGEILSRSSREFHYTVEPERDTSGLSIPGGKIIITKLYEKSL